MPAPDRLERLLAQAAVTGLDFIYVYPDQLTLDVFFLRAPLGLTRPLSDLTTEQIRISGAEGEEWPAVPVARLSWERVDNRDALRITTAVAGGFSTYALRIEDERIDPYYNDLSFSFKANCPSDIDCRMREPEPPADVEDDVPIDYTARDFWSFRRALLDFASLRHPHWTDRLEADAGIMLAEAMSALGDEMAYYQDRVAREAHLETATQRRSLRRHARLVDYPLDDGLGAWTWLEVTVHSGQSGLLRAGTKVWAQSDQGVVMYQVGRGLDESLASTPYAVDSRRNSLEPHLWDEDEPYRRTVPRHVLPLGATELFVDGRHNADLPLDDQQTSAPGRWVLLQSTPADPSQPVRVHLVRLVSVQETRDPVLNEDVTRLTWEQGQALPFEMALASLKVRGNLVPASAGEQVVARFTIGPSADEEEQPSAIERRGPNGTVAYLFSLRESSAPESGGVVWRREPGGGRVPEVRVAEVDGAGEEVRQWGWRPSLMGEESSQATDRHFILDDGTWDRVVAFQRAGRQHVHVDYARGSGNTIRFGDNVFGRIPPARTVFEVTYRVGNGAHGNVPAGSLTSIDSAASFVQGVTNPFAATNGIDPEPPARIRALAPEAFRSRTFRAVRPDDYAEAAQRLPWVQRAGATFRWTGSWLSAFVTPDPRGSSTLMPSQQAELRGHLEGYRQAGREVHVSSPQYADVDLAVVVCVEPGALASEVKEGVRQALLGRGGAPARPGFFSADNFTFGMPLDRSALEAKVQAVPGVRAVQSMSIRRRGWSDWRDFTELALGVADREVIRLENDPLHPERGSLRLVMEGGG